MTTQGQNKIKNPSISHAGSARTFFWHVFFGALAVFHLVTNAHYLKILGGYFPCQLGKPYFLFIFYFLALPFMKHLKDLRGKDSK